jgi:outer membrane murein-binding lipoprotein Lpp
MKNKMLLTMGLVAALMAAGCASTAGSASQPEAAPAAETVQAQQDAEAEDGKEAAEAGQEATEAGQDAAQQTQDAASQIVKYESKDGWSASYNSAAIEVIEDDAVYFNYKGDAEGTNQISVMYYPNQMPDEVLGAAMTVNNEIPDHTRSEGYFAGRTDVWSLRTSVESSVFPNATDDFIAVERNGGTLLVQITTTKQAEETKLIAVSDEFSEIINSFELKDQQPQTYSQYVPGKYAVVKAKAPAKGADYYVQFNEDHTGVLHLQDDISVIWYSREGKVLNAETGEQIYEYVLEGDSLYLRDSADENAEMIEFARLAGENA